MLALILTFGILSWFVCAIFGVLAWMWGNEDLRKMDAGRMDPEGRSLAQIGKILGMVSVILNLVGAVLVLLYFCVIFAIIGAAAGGAGR